MKRIGIEPGKSLTWDQLSPEVQSALNSAPKQSVQAIHARMPSMAVVKNYWQMNTDTMGVYGDYYLKRAVVAMLGLGANQPEDAIYPINIGDANGKPLLGQNKYVMHFDKNNLPPVDAFWSLTMYDEGGFQTANPINRFAIGDRDALKYNPDGSLDLYLQHDNPGPGKESNWLPSPASGTLGITLRLYAPKPDVLEGRWAPPPVQPA
jgi:hypothetical protein